MSDATPATPRGMSFTAYARRIGVSQPYVSKAVRTGKIPASALIDPDGERLIDAAAADKALGKAPKDTSREGAVPPAGVATVEPSPVGAAASTGSERGKPDGKRDGGGVAASSSSRGGRPAKEGPSYTDVRTTREGWLAKQAELEYRKRAGELCETGSVRKAISEHVTTACRALDQLADRIAGRCAAEIDVRKVHAIIATEARRIRNEVADLAEAQASADGQTRQ